MVDVIYTIAYKNRWILRWWLQEPFVKGKGHFSKVAHDKKPNNPPRRAKSKRRNVNQHQEFSKQFYVQAPEKEHRVSDQGKEVGRTSYVFMGTVSML